MKQTGLHAMRGDLGGRAPSLLRETMLQLLEYSQSKATHDALGKHAFWGNNYFSSLHGPNGILSIDFQKSPLNKREFYDSPRSPQPEKYRTLLDSGVTLTS